MSDFYVTESILEKTTTHERADGVVSYSRKQIARHIMLKGTDWLFAERSILEKSDQEIDEAVEYHRANVSLLLSERESRKVERYKKLSGIKVPTIKHESQEEREKREQKALSKGNKKTKTKDIKIDDTSAILDAFKKLIKAGIKPEQISELLKGKK